MTDPTPDPIAEAVERLMELAVAHADILNRKAFRECLDCRGQIDTELRAAEARADAAATARCAATHDAIREKGHVEGYESCRAYLNGPACLPEAHEAIRREAERRGEERVRRALGVRCDMGQDAQRVRFHLECDTYVYRGTAAFWALTGEGEPPQDTPAEVGEGRRSDVESNPDGQAETFRP